VSYWPKTHFYVCCGVLLVSLVAVSPAQKPLVMFESVGKIATIDKPAEISLRLENNLIELMKVNYSAIRLVITVEALADFDGLRLVAIPDTDDRDPVNLGVVAFYPRGGAGQVSYAFSAGPLARLLRPRQKQLRLRFIPISEFRSAGKLLIQRISLEFNP
jgi:hypothetical protein